MSLLPLPPLTPYKPGQVFVDQVRLVLVRTVACAVHYTHGKPGVGVEGLEVRSIRGAGVQE